MQETLSGKSLQTNDPIPALSNAGFLGHCAAKQVLAGFSFPKGTWGG
jgi:hypothetical protein